MSQNAANDANRKNSLARVVTSNYAFGMGSATFVEDFNEAFEFTPVEGCPNRSVIHSKTLRHRRVMPKPDGGRGEMTEADWDKFEKDIEDAFEQVP